MLESKSKWIMIIFVGIFIALLLTACGGTSEEPTSEPVTIDSFTTPLSFEGKVISRTSLEMSFSSPGLIDQMNVRLGDFVQAGDELAVLNANDFLAAIQVAESALNLAEANLTQVSQQFANPNAGAVVVAQAQVDEAQINLDIAQAKLEDSKLIAPINGVISQIYTDQYEYTFAGQAVLQLKDSENKSVRLLMNEFDLTDIHVGDSVVVTFDNFPTLEESGVVASILPDEEIDQSGQFFVIIDLQGNSQSIQPGLTAEVIFNTDSAELSE